MSAITDIPLDKLLNPDKIPDIDDEMAIYRENLKKFPLLHKQQNSQCNCSFIAVVALCLLSYA